MSDSFAMVEKVDDRMNIVMLAREPTVENYLKFLAGGQEKVPEAGGIQSEDFYFTILTKVWLICLGKYILKKFTEMITCERRGLLDT